MKMGVDEIEWFEDFDQQDEKELQSEAENAIVQASVFYDLEAEKYEKE